MVSIIKWNSKANKERQPAVIRRVNAGSVRELKRSEKYDYIYYLKDTDESILDKNITSKLSFKTKFEAIKMILHGLKDALLYLFAYFIFYAIFTIRQNENAPIYLAFAAAISAILISFVKIFKLDPTYGPIVTMLIGAGVSCIITGW